MSKYVYEQFVTPDQREKMTNDASGVRKTYFAAGKLDPLTPEKRLNTLYSAIRDVEGDETHPIQLIASLWFINSRTFYYRKYISRF
jgi:hypothetical protein